MRVHLLIWEDQQQKMIVSKDNSTAFFPTEWTALAWHTELAVETLTYYTWFTCNKILRGRDVL